MNKKNAITDFIKPDDFVSVYFENSSLQNLKVLSVPYTAGSCFELKDRNGTVFMVQRFNYIQKLRDANFLFSLAKTEKTVLNEICDKCTNKGKENYWTLFCGVSCPAISLALLKLKEVIHEM